MYETHTTEKRSEPRAGGVDVGSSGTLWTEILEFYYYFESNDKSLYP